MTPPPRPTRQKARAPRRRRATATAVPLAGDPQWYKDAIIYETHVRAFYDSNADGVGDFAGLAQKLDYLHELGITAIWLLPFYPSPLRDDGYDIARYKGVNERYGTLRDVRRFIREAHARGIRVITELVVNHTSDQHPWFERARNSPPGSKFRDFYVWSDTKDRYTDARIIFKDFESSNWTWDPVAGAYFWHRFYHHQPDLNFDHPPVHDALLDVLDFWLDAGVDGMRLDAVPYLYERDGTNCENLDETHAFLKKLRAHIDEHYNDRMILAEANQWPEDASAYFGDGDECHMNFHFPLMPRLFMAVRMEDRYPIIDILEQTPTIPDSCQWAVFLRNHDELTLEMVSDEERDYMYRVYAHDARARINLGIRRRLAPLLNNDRKKIELMVALLLSLPGSPVLYYGDEIGMGDNIYLGDRDAVRTPMQWSADRNAGFGRSNPQRLFLPVVTDPEYSYTAVNVEAQQGNLSSLLWWHRRIIALRKRHRVFGRGSIRFFTPDNPKILAFLREHEGERVLVVANLSRFSQYVHLDLAPLEGDVPVEMFGNTRFPPIGAEPYFLTLAPHSFNWFLLEPADAPVGVAEEAAKAPATALRSDDVAAWLVSRAGRGWLERRLEAVVPLRAWFAGKHRVRRGSELESLTPLPRAADDHGRTIDAALAIMRFKFPEGDDEFYTCPIAVCHADRVAALTPDHADAIIGRLTLPNGEERIVVDAAAEPLVTAELLKIITARRRLKGDRGEAVGHLTKEGRKLLERPVDPSPGGRAVERRNTTVVVGDRLALKLFRRLEPGINPAVEIGEHLTDDLRFQHSPALVGAITHEPSNSPRLDRPVTIAMLQAYAPHEASGRQRFLAGFDDYIDRVLATGAAYRTPHLPGGHAVLELADEPVPADVADAIGPTLDEAALLGARVGELHAALADIDAPAFTPEPYSKLDQRSLFQSMRTNARRTLKQLERRRADLPADATPLADDLLARADTIIDHLARLTHERIAAVRIRGHGDLHLDQCLWTGKDWTIIDFEGDAGRPLGERRLKRSPLADVAAMLRSFHYTCEAGLERQLARGTIAGEPDEAARFRPWADVWHGHTAAAFLRSYLAVAGRAPHPLIPAAHEPRKILLDAWVIDTACRELREGLDASAERADIPLAGIQAALGGPPPPDPHDAAQHPVVG